MGLGTAYIKGFKYALENNYDYIFEMDADFSHDPKEIPNFLKEISSCDLVLGSRYKDGVNVVNWPMRRLMLSLFANVYTRIVTGMPVHDATGGFKCFKKEVLQSINLNEVRSNGYAFQIEMTFKAWKKGFKIKEISIVFTDRVKGTSKMSKKIVREAIFMVWKLRFANMFGILK
jgi:dolichol-phosphate mannosyltransferase